VHVTDHTVGDMKIPTTFLPQNRPTNRQNQAIGRTYVIEQKRRDNTRVGS